ncbi:hypothetical protein [Phytohabitans rumicis]|uniref:hypothetical protein n=1 Tax=Phytohabitans rumicis TaxID=1076125 RepID=UPI0031EAF1B4
MSLRDRLGHPDDEVRLAAARRAAISGDLGLVDPLLEMALHDTAEVRTEGGIAEVYEHVGDAAAQALGRILGRRQEDDPRIRAAALDLDLDDDRVATLLHFLGPKYEPLRRELETHAEDRVRLRAVRAVLSIDRTGEFSARFVTDPAAAVRVEALEVPATVLDLDVCLRLLREDPAPSVRTVAARSLRFTPVGSEPFIAAARVERDPRARAMLLSCLVRRRRDRPNALAVAGFFADAAPYTRSQACEALRGVDDAAVGAAIAVRVLTEPDERKLIGLLGYRHLLTHAPELRAVLERMRRHTRQDGQRWALDGALAVEPPPDTGARPDPVDGLDGPQRARLGREVLRQAAAAIEPRIAAAPDQGETRALGCLRAWLARPGEATRGALRAELDAAAGSVGDPDAPRIEEVWDCLGAALSGDVRDAMRAAAGTAAQAARRDPLWSRVDPVRGPVVAARRARELTRLVHLYTARLIRAGVDPVPSDPVRRLLLDGEDLGEDPR